MKSNGGAEELWSTKIRYVGVGAMVVGGVATILKVRGSLVDAVKIITERRGSTEEAPATERNISTVAIAFWSLVATVLVAGVYYTMTDSVAITAATTVIMLAMSLFFTAVASYIVGLVGNSNSPVSGMTITAVLFTGALLYVFQFSGTEGMVATLGVAAIVCCAACTSGDVCNDLKTGQLVGASPFKQQIMQIIGVGAGCLVMAPVLQVLHEQTPGGIGGKELSAPQASLFANLARGFFGDHELPWDMVGIGAGVGVGLLVLDRFLEKSQAGFRAYVMPTAVGMYLPLSLATPILIGGILNYLVTRGSKSTEEVEERSRRGLLWSSGVIAGEALTGVGLALVASVGLQRLELGTSEAGEAAWLEPATWVAAIVLVVVFARQARNPRS